MPDSASERAVDKMEKPVENRELLMRKEILRLFSEFRRPLSAVFIAYSLGVTQAEAEHFIRFLSNRRDVAVDENGYVTLLAVP